MAEADRALEFRLHGIRHARISYRTRCAMGMPCLWHRFFRVRPLTRDDGKFLLRILTGSRTSAEAPSGCLKFFGKCV